MFLLDANVLIEASRHYYHHQIAPSFWSWLAQEHDQGVLGSVRAVRDELIDAKVQGGDAEKLSLWASGLNPTFWQEPDDRCATSLRDIALWVQREGARYTPAAVTEFLRIADYPLVAQAHASGSVVVTFEKSEPNAKRRIKIPDVCSAFGVGVINPFEFYRVSGLRFAAAV